MAIALVTTIMAALRVFDLVYVTTRGGPGMLVTGSRVPGGLGEPDRYAQPLLRS
jgi:ABC-type sugar transport system permease subunit